MPIPSKGDFYEIQRNLEMQIFEQKMAIFKLSLDASQVLVAF
jgi:hypothetical protein